MVEQRIQQQFFESADLQYQAAESLARPLADAAAALVGTITGGGKVMVCGSGKSAWLAAHMAALLVGRFERERPPLAALAVAAPPDAQINALGHPGDALLLLEGGDTAAALAALAAAHGKEMTAVVVAGGAAAAALREPLAETDVMITVAHERVVRVVELQLLALHCLCDAIDVQLMGEQDP